LDPADTSTITEVGGAVSQIDDKSGNARNFTQAVGASQPATGTRTQNGLNVLDFDGTADFLTGGNILNVGTGGVTLFGVVKMDDAPTTGPQVKGIIAKQLANNIAGRYGLAWSVPNVFITAFFQDTAARTAGSDPSPRTDTYVYAQRVIRNSASTQWRNGSVVATNSTLSGTENYTPTHPFLIGAFGDTPGTGILADSYLDGFVGEVLVFMRDLSDTEMGAVNNYLNAKWSVY
jgi:hypothetical protein